MNENGGMAPGTQPVSDSAFSRFAMTDAGGAEVRANGVQVDAAMAGHVGQAIAIVLLPKADLNDNRFDGLFQAVAANARDGLGAAFGHMLHHPEYRSLAFEQLAQSCVYIDAWFHVWSCILVLLGYAGAGK